MDYSLITPFWIDTDGYTDRDREMFVCGVEFEMIRDQLKRSWRGLLERRIHAENASRIRMLCGKYSESTRCEITDTEYSEWKQLTMYRGGQPDIPV